MVHVLSELGKEPKGPQTGAETSRGLRVRSAWPAAPMEGLMSATAKRRIISLLATTALATGITSVAGAPTAQAKSLTLCGETVDVTHHNGLTSHSKLCDLLIGDSQDIAVDTTASGVEEGFGAAQFTATSTDQTFTIPLTSVGTLNNGEHLLFILNDTETAPNGTQIAVLTTSRELECDLDASGTGTCT